ncbi:hypothetical protein JD969_09220 [Planctomycetota bacterium]|nr:hypothetical protein JD969_09220 [Planctomycetota bacterium]
MNKQTSVNWIKFNNTSEQINQLTTGFDWDDAYIREIQIISPAFIKDNFIQHFGAEPAARIYIEGSHNPSALELLLVDVGDFELSFTSHLACTIKLNTSSFADYPIDISLVDCPHRKISAKQLYYRFLDEHADSFEPCYSKKRLHSIKTGELNIFDDEVDQFWDEIE